MSTELFKNSVIGGFFMLLPAHQAQAEAPKNLGPVHLQAHQGLDFNLARPKPSFTIRYHLSPRLLNNTKPSHYEILIATADADIVSTLVTKRALTAKEGQQSMAWDGKDEHGQFVPDEIYYPLIRYTVGDKVIDIHPRDYSGGIIAKPQVQTDRHGTINFSIAQPSRILVRAGIKSGAFLRTLLDWRPRPAGQNRLSWDGFDESGVYRFIQHPRFAVMVTGYTLPELAIMIINSPQKTDYSTWRNLQGCKAQPFTREEALQKFDRAQLPLSKIFFEPRYRPKDPQLSISYTQKAETNPVLSKRTGIKVDVPQASRALLEQSLFEVAFFVDGDFISEEEQGYVPFIWTLDPTRFAAGDHVLTVNILGFDGQVGSASLLFRTTHEDQHNPSHH